MSGLPRVPGGRSMFPCWLHPSLSPSLPAFPSWRDHWAQEGWEDGSSLLWDSFQALKSPPLFVALPGLRAVSRHPLREKSRFVLPVPTAWSQVAPVAPTWEPLRGTAECVCAHVCAHADVHEHVCGGSGVGGR